MMSAKCQYTYYNIILKGIVTISRGELMPNFQFNFLLPISIIVNSYYIEICHL